MSQESTNTPTGRTPPPGKKVTIVTVDESSIIESGVSTARSPSMAKSPNAAKNVKKDASSTKTAREAASTRTAREPASTRSAREPASTKTAREPKSARRTKEDASSSKKSRRSSKKGTKRAKSTEKDQNSTRTAREPKSLREPAKSSQNEMSSTKMVKEPISGGSTTGSTSPLLVKPPAKPIAMVWVDESTDDKDVYGTAPSGNSTISSAKEQRKRRRKRRQDQPSYTSLNERDAADDATVVSSVADNASTPDKLSTDTLNSSSTKTKSSEKPTIKSTTTASQINTGKAQLDHIHEMVRQILTESYQSVLNEFSSGERLTNKEVPCAEIRDLEALKRDLHEHCENGMRKVARRVLRRFKKAHSVPKFQSSETGLGSTSDDEGGTQESEATSESGKNLSDSVGIQKKIRKKKDKWSFVGVKSTQKDIRVIRETNVNDDEKTLKDVESIRKLLIPKRRKGQKNEVDLSEENSLVSSHNGSYADIGGGTDLNDVRIERYQFSGTPNIQSVINFAKATFNYWQHKQKPHYTVAPRLSVHMNASIKESCKTHCGYHPKPANESHTVFVDKTCGKNVVTWTKEKEAEPTLKGIGI
ncbi:unnamed protein product [Bursaphelenchus okinawaensis]|uniref:Uncharacterized protein n=1 Tax=Bursaphelenchus okinawaensis TaxID=465554 RepID=A0A811K5Y8_9BILA|nr:unnamed protein product [Bursaphelenchus okinawaensis]CAG9092063.1 unnamed protein product [Bursaphelenchus okinawaensis]